MRPGSRAACARLPKDRPQYLNGGDDGDSNRHGGSASRLGGGTAEAQRHKEGPIARGIEDHTAQLPSDTFLWAAGAWVAVSLGLIVGGKRHAALFVGQWAPPILLLGLSNKIVKVAGSDRTQAG